MKLWDLAPNFYRNHIVLNARNVKDSTLCNPKAKCIKWIQEMWEKVTFPKNASALEQDNTQDTLTSNADILETNPWVIFRSSMTVELGNLFGK